MAEGPTARAEAEVVELTSRLIRFDTTNRGGGDGREREAAEFVAERLTDAGLRPELLEAAPGRSNVVARVPGRDRALPALLLHGHLDVVPADAAEWTVPPFSGEVRGGAVWGRGAIDMKNALAMNLTLVADWARRGVRPRRDVVLAFTADEEDKADIGSGYLADHHAELFAGCAEGISESGGYSFQAGDRRLYPISAGERGTGWLRLTARGRAGHGSKHNPDNAVARLARAVARFGDHAWPLRLTDHTRATLTALVEATGAELTAEDLQRPGADVDALLARLGPAAALLASVLRNSATPTALRAGGKVNVIPSTAEALVDGRVLPGLREEFERTVDKLAGDVAWSYLHREVALSAPLDGPTYPALCAALRAEDPEAVPVPTVMSGGTDAKQFSRLGIRGYGYTPLRLPAGYDYAAMFHGVDERVPVSALTFGLRVLDRLLINL